MKFKINGTEWSILEVSADKMNNEQKNDYTLDLTIYTKQEIWLLEGQPNIIATLKHELTHVWLYEYAHIQHEEIKYCYEEVCEIVAKSNEFINKVTNKYKREKVK